MTGIERAWPAYVARWIEQHPRAKDSTKELYRGLLRGCISPDIGPVGLTALTPDAVRSWHYRLGRRLATDIAAERDRLALAGRAPSSATVRDGRTRQAQAYRLLRAAMATAHDDGLISEQPCRITGGGTPSTERRTPRPGRAAPPPEAGLGRRRGDAAA